MLAQLNLLGSARTGASSLERLVTIPRITFSMRVKISLLENKRYKALNMGWQKPGTGVLNMFHDTSASAISIYIVIEYSTFSGKSEKQFMDETNRNVYF